MSAGINTVSGTLYEDFIQNCMPKNSTEAVASFIMKIIVVLIGIICVLLVYLVEKMGEIIQVSKFLFFFVFLTRSLRDLIYNFIILNRNVHRIRI